MPGARLRELSRDPWGGASIPGHMPARDEREGGADPRRGDPRDGADRRPVLDEDELAAQALAASADADEGAESGARDSEVPAGFEGHAPIAAAPRLDSGPSGPRTWPFALALAALVFAAFSPAFGAGWTNWDDPRNFLNNEAYRGLTPDHVWWMFTSYHMAHWHPLTWMTLGFDHVVWGMKPLGYHLTSIVVHALAAGAAFVCARLLFARVRPSGTAASASVRDGAAFVAAALFAVHPLRAESVAWITERRDVLSGLFFFLALGAWLKSVAPLAYSDGSLPDEARRKAWRRSSVIFFVLAGMSKVSVFVLPFVLLVFDVWPLQRVKERGIGALLREKVPHFAIAAALMVVAWIGQFAVARTMYTLEQWPLQQRLVQTGFGLFLYPFKTFVPRNMSPMYMLPSNEVMLTQTFVVPALIGTGVALVALALGKKLPAIAAAWACFLITIAPVSGLTQAGSQIAADRYSYLACVPFAFLVGGAIFLWPRPRAAIASAAAVGALLVGVVGFLCWKQTHVWRDSESLWRQALVVQPNNTFAFDSLASLRGERAMEERDPQKKLALLREAFTLYDDAYRIDQDPRHLAAAAETIKRFAEVEPEKREEHLKRALETLDQGLNEARARNATIQPAWTLQRANLLLDLGRVPEAQQEVSAYLRIVPNDPHARAMAGLMLADSGYAKEALPHLQFAIQNGVSDAPTWAAMGVACEALGMLEPAREAWTRIIEARRRALGNSGEGDPYVQLALEKLRGLDRAKPR